MKISAIKNNKLTNNFLPQKNKKVPTFNGKAEIFTPKAFHSYEDSIENWIRLKHPKYTNIIQEEETGSKELIQENKAVGCNFLHRKSVYGAIFCTKRPSVGHTCPTTIKQGKSRGRRCPLTLPSPRGR